VVRTGTICTDCTVTTRSRAHAERFGAIAYLAYQSNAASRAEEEPAPTVKMAEVNPRSALSVVAGRPIS